jgi:hypothetical protein
MVGVYQIDVMFMWGILFILYGHGLIGSGVLLGKKKKKKNSDILFITIYIMLKRSVWGTRTTLRIEQIE